MEQKIDDLVDLIKETQQYRDFVASSQELERSDVKELLESLQAKIAQINDLKQYGEYVDLSTLNQELGAIRKEVSKNETVQKYYRDYYAVNEMLDRLTKIIFKDISADLILNDLNFRSK